MANQTLFLTLIHFVKSFEFIVPPGEKPNLAINGLTTSCPYPYSLIVKERILA